jgi:ribosomal-protein-alanine N-acetyltransferase
MMRTMLRTRLRPMAAEDIAQIIEIERESFPSIWPHTAYRRELTNKIARYLVVTEVNGAEAGYEPAQSSPGILGALRRMVGGEVAPASHESVLGFIGVWLVIGEAHIVTVAVRERFRRLGIGERLLIAAVELAMEADEEAVTLEVRSSNEAAQQLYLKYGFARVGLRKRYYTDNHEDAVLMTTTPDLFSPQFRARFQDLRGRHQREHPDLWDAAS